MKKVLLISFLALIKLTAAAQVPTIEWQKSLGGSNDDIAHSVHQTSDGGYIVAGECNSNDGNVSGNHGNTDYWVVKLNDTGGIQWQRSLGGSSYDYAESVQQTFDGGYIVAGYSSSADGDITASRGGDDYWIVKLNETGAIQWQKSLGGGEFDDAFSVQQTTDSGYIVAGRSASSHGDVTGHHADWDYWVVKLNDTGAIQWQKSLGGSNGDQACSIQQTFDRGYIVAGFSESADGDVSGHHGPASTSDCWVVKLNDAGAIGWQQSFGGSINDYGRFVSQTRDGGYIVAGSCTSVDGDLTGRSRPGMDYWVIKLNDTGHLQWQKCFGGSDAEIALSILQTSDDGYIVAGFTISHDGDVMGSHGADEYWILKLNDTGGVQWQKCLGGTAPDQAYSIQQIPNGYIVAGSSQSINGDVSGNHGLLDYWVVKLTCGLNAGIISGDSIACFGSHITLTDTASGGIWSLSNSHATISSGIVTGVSSGLDTAIYTVSNTCGSISARFPLSVIMCPEDANTEANTPPIALLPNPTSGIIFISGISSANIKVYNTLGQLIKEAVNTTSINISAFPAAMYFVRLFNEQGELLKQDKIIKSP